mmetsp:Transcript_23539/g.31574  ORF Transcript_23539/g.31574 Transcript_23539/m.31574 type:complete len:92 (-) Transcript_23539:274-549(-)
MFEKVIVALMSLAMMAEAKSDNFDLSEVKGLFSANESINKWINPNAFVGILLTLVFFWVCQCVFSLMGNIQTPKIMLEKELDWGKIEKVDE